MLCPASLVASITAAAIAMSEGKSSEEINLLGTVFTQLGDTLTTISVQKDNIESKCNKDSKQA